MITLPDFVRSTGDVARDLPAMVAEQGTVPLVITDASLLSAGVTGVVRDGLRCDVIVLPTGEPQTETVGVAARQIAEFGADVVIAVGGGSVIDSAKLAARLITEPDGLLARLGAVSSFPAGAAVVALPTTAGSGAEVTRTAIVSHHGRKTWAWSDSLRPDLAVLAPELSVSSPRSVTVAAGLDAFCHGVEAASGRRSTPEIRALGFEAAAVVHRSLASALADPDDVALRSDLLRAAAAAGVAIDHCGTGIGHAVGHALASAGTIPHGIAVMHGLRSGLEWTLETAGPTFDGLAELLGSPSLPAALDAILDGVGFRAELARWTPPSHQALVDELRAPEQQPMCANNARPIGADDIDALARTVLERWMS